jgi:hypothetical protein
MVVTDVLVLVGVVVMVVVAVVFVVEVECAGGCVRLVDVLVDANNSTLRALHSAPRATHSCAPTLRRNATRSALF